MFGKKCPHCKNKIKRDYQFCPHCGNDFKTIHDEKDFGFLGKDDSIENNLPFKDTFVDKILNSAMKIVEKQMKNINNDMRNQRNNKNSPNFPGLNVQFFVNGEKVFQDEHEQPEKQPIKLTNQISKDKLKKFASFPKIEPKSNIRRLSNKIIYEILLPGVESIDDVLINQLENSIEIKAISHDKIYSKNLKLNLPISNFKLINDSLLIEMQVK